MLSNRPSKLPEVIPFQRENVFNMRQTAAGVTNDLIWGLEGRELKGYCSCFFFVALFSGLENVFFLLMLLFLPQALSIFSSSLQVDLFLLFIQEESQEMRDLGPEPGSLAGAVRGCLGRSPNPPLPRKAGQAFSEDAFLFNSRVFSASDRIMGVNH